MNAARKPKAVRMVRFGDVLFDDLKRLTLLCRNCQRAFVQLNAFQAHLGICAGLEHIIEPIDELRYDEAKRETKVLNGRQELHIYDIAAVRSVNDDDSHPIDWEAELDDPRWYTDEQLPATTAKLKPTNTKENVAKKLCARSPMKMKEGKQQQRKTTSPKAEKRPILMSQQQRRTRSSLETTTTATTTNCKPRKEVQLVPKVVEDLKRLEAVAAKPTSAVVITTTSAKATPTPKLTPTPKPASTTVANITITAKATPTPKPTPTPKVAPPVAEAKPPVKAKDTQQILNKLRACGVEVKTRNKREEATTTVTTPTKNQLALDIMAKLQSKGIKCTKVNNAKKPKLELT